MNQNDSDRYYLRFGYRWSGDGRSEEQAKKEARGPVPKHTRASLIVLGIAFLGTTIVLLFFRWAEEPSPPSRRRERLRTVGSCLLDHFGQQRVFP